MGKTNKCNIREDESLAHEVQKYRCLYDKTNKGYKERDRKSNAWREIEEHLGYEEGTSAKKFEILKKRYSKKRNALKGKRASGADLSGVVTEEKQLKEYSFMAWLHKFTRPRSTTTNFVDNDTDYIDEESDIDDDVSIEYLLREEAGDVDESTQPDPERSQSSKVKREIILPRIEKSRAQAPKKESLKSRELSIMQGMETIVQRRLNSSSSTEDDDGDFIFGKLIASELKHFDEDEKSELKHEMYSLIYKCKKAKRVNKSQQYTMMAQVSSPIFIPPQPTVSPQAPMPLQSPVTAQIRSPVPQIYQTTLLPPKKNYSPNNLMQQFASPTHSTISTCPLASPTHASHDVAPQFPGSPYSQNGLSTNLGSPVYYQQRSAAEETLNIEG